MKRPASPIIGKVTRYGRFMRWLAVDALWRLKGLVIAVVGGGAAAVALQVQAIALTVYYAHLFEEAKTLRLLGRAYEPRQSIGLLLMFGAAVGILLLLSAGLQYVSRVSALRLRRRYGDVCSTRVLDILRGAPDRLPITMQPLDARTLMRLARTDAMFCGRLVSILVNIMTPALTLVASLVALLYISPVLTILVVLVAVVCMGFLYRTNVAAARDSRLTEDYKRPAAAELSGLIQARGWSVGPDRADAEQEEAHAAPLPMTERWLDVFMRRLRAVDDSELVTNVFLAIILTVILLGLGTEAIRGQQSWQSMLAYLVALRYALVTFRGAARIITSVNRFYPQVRRYLEFIESAAEPDRSRQPPREEYVIRGRGSGGGELLKEAVLRRGQRLSLVGSVVPSLYSLPHLFGCVFDQEPEATRAAVGASRLAMARSRIPEGALSESLGCGHEEWSRLAQWAAVAGMTDLLKRHLPSTPTEELGEAAWDAMPPALRLLVVAAAIAGDEAAQWVFFEQTDLARLDAAARGMLLAALGNRIVVIIANKTAEDVGQCEEDVIAVWDGRRLIGLGDRAWITTGRALMETVLAGARRTDLGADAESNDDLDEDG